MIDIPYAYAKRARLARTALVVAVGLVAGACADSPIELEPDAVPQFGKGNGNGNGNGNGGGPPGGGGGSSDSPLTVTLGSGTITDDGGGAYIDGIGGVDATLNEGGALQFLVTDSDPRQAYIGEIVDEDGGTVRVPETGLHGLLVQSKACCDLRALDVGDLVKIELEWNVPDGKYVVSLGSTTSCSDTGGPWAQIVGRDVAGVDTTWTIQSQGTAHLCEIIDKKGKKNDSTTGYGILFDLDLTASTMND